MNKLIFNIEYLLNDIGILPWQQNQ